MSQEDFLSIQATDEELEPMTLQVCLVGNGFVVFGSDKKETRSAGWRIPTTHDETTKFLVRDPFVYGFSGSPNCPLRAEYMASRLKSDELCQAGSPLQTLRDIAESFQPAARTNEADEILIICRSPKLVCWLVSSYSPPQGSVPKVIQQWECTGDRRTLATFLLEHFYAQEKSERELVNLASLVLWYGHKGNTSNISEKVDLLVCREYELHQFTPAELNGLHKKVSRFDKRIRRLLRKNDS